MLTFPTHRHLSKDISTSQHIVRQVGRCMWWKVYFQWTDFKTQLCLWAPPGPISLTRFWYTNLGLAWTPESPHPLREKLCQPLHHLNDWWRCIKFLTEIEEEKHIKLSYYLLQLLSILKALQGLGSMCFTPGLKLQRQLNCTNCLVPHVVSNTQNRALKKTEDGFKP